MRTAFGLEPSLAEDMGPDFEIDSFGGRGPTTRQAKLKESRVDAPPLTEDAFDDTFNVSKARLHPCRENNPGRFTRGMPTNDTSSSENYPKRDVRIIDGEHKTLLSLGKINEAMDTDDDNEHIMEHRILLSDPNLSETQRAALMDHIESHGKNRRKKLKAVAEAQGKNRPDITPRQGYRPGLGQVSKVKPALVDDVIPQDDPQSTERKRTAGNMAMESKLDRFDKAVTRAYGGGGGRSRRGL